MLAACLRVGLIKEGAGELEERGRGREPGEAAAGGVLGAQLLAGLGGGQVEGDGVDIGLGPREAGLQGAIGMDLARFRRVSLSNCEYPYIYKCVTASWIPGRTKMVKKWV